VFKMCQFAIQHSISLQVYLCFVNLQINRNPPKRVLTVWVTRHVCPGDHAAKAKVSSLDALAFTWFASTTRLP
jgi:hypothetical protein